VYIGFAPNVNVKGVTIEHNLYELGNGEPADAKNSVRALNVRVPAVVLAMGMVANKL
jgi:hypothetical protein